MSSHAILSRCLAGVKKSFLCSGGFTPPSRRLLVARVGAQTLCPLGFAFVGAAFRGRPPTHMLADIRDECELTTYTGNRSAVRSVVLPDS
jgi:hypothetical protein